MRSTTAEEKKNLRNSVRTQLAALTEQERKASDDQLFKRFLALPEVACAKRIFAFWGIRGREPDTARLIGELIARGKTVCLPRMLPAHQMEARLYVPEVPLLKKEFGIWEPDPARCPTVEKSAIDLVLVPGVCYDRRGYRLGFGGGYYDRWLEDFSGFTVGLCRQVVLQQQVPTDAHDSRVHILLTERELFC